MSSPSSSSYRWRDLQLIYLLKLPLTCWPGPVLYQYQYPHPPLVLGPALPAAVYGGAAVPPDDVITEDGLKLELLVTR